MIASPNLMGESQNPLLWKHVCACLNNASQVPTCVVGNYEYIMEWNVDVVWKCTWICYVYTMSLACPCAYVPMPSTCQCTYIITRTTQWYLWCIWMNTMNTMKIGKSFPSVDWKPSDAGARFSGTRAEKIFLLSRGRHEEYHIFLSRVWSMQGLLN